MIPPKPLDFDGDGDKVKLSFKDQVVSIASLTINPRDLLKDGMM